MALLGGVFARRFCKPPAPYNGALVFFQQPPGPIMTRPYVSMAEFRRDAFDVEKPLILELNTSDAFPAISRWFPVDGTPATPVRRLTPYFEALAARDDCIVPYELHWGIGDGSVPAFQSWLSKSTDETHTVMAEVLGRSLSSSGPPLEGSTMTRFHGPLALFTAALKFNEGSPCPLSRLYIAQASLDDLPGQLQRDIPAPNIVRSAGKGDVYGSSIWLGLEPTYTPWHRDPNPNLLCQLCGSKDSRLLKPRLGEDVFRQVQLSLGKSGNPRIRGEEMMQGPERSALDAAIWGPDAPAAIHQVSLTPGQALFIPKGWWHSVKSRFADGRVNSSVNWWFR